MKKLVLKLIIFSAPLLIIFSYTEFRLKHILNSYTIKKTFLENNTNKIETLTVGSSQALYGINPEYLSGTTLNLGNASQSLYFDCALVEKYVDKLSSLKHVIIPISYFSFFSDMNDGKEKIRTYAYYHFFNIKNHSFSFWDAKNYSLIPLLGIKRVVAVAKSNFKQLDDESVATMTNKGFLPMDSANSKHRINDSLGKLRFNYHTTLIKKENLTTNIEALEKLLLHLTSKNIKISFISTPTYKTYYKNFDNKILQQNDSLINVLCKKYHCNYFNWQTDTSFIKEDFYDNDHLNKYGAAKFSKLLDLAIKHN